VRVGRLAQDDEHAIAELLDEDRVVNLFLIGFLDRVPMDQVYWYGAFDGDRAVGVALVLAGHLAVPYAPDPQDAARIGAFLRGRHAATLTVGPRAAVDALWSSWAPDVRPARRLDQRLYVCREVARDVPEGPVRPAHPDEAPRIEAWSRSMEIEDLGRDPAIDLEEHARVVRARIEQGRTWVMDVDGSPGFLVSVGTTTPDGCQVGGTWVPPALRGRGVATRGMAGLVRRLLRVHPLVTLHVSEANTPAVRCYERVGFERSAPFRLLTVEPTPGIE
jgi:ribosomal protein S18 acetylase RimI-like enzyme